MKNVNAIEFLLIKAERAHQRIDERLRVELGRPAPDQLRLTLLKRRKLAAKDRLHALARLRDQMTGRRGDGAAPALLKA